MEEETLFVTEMPTAAGGSGWCHAGGPSLITRQILTGLLQEMRRGVMLKFLRTLQEPD